MSDGGSDYEILCDYIQLVYLQRTLCRDWRSVYDVFVHELRDQRDLDERQTSLDPERERGCCRKSEASSGLLRLWKERVQLRPAVAISVQH